MMRAITVVVLVAVLILGTILANRGDEAETTHVHTTSDMTITRVLSSETAPTTLPANFGQLVAAMRPKPGAKARTAPMRRTAAFVDAGAWSCGGPLPPCSALNRENPDRDLMVYNGGCHHEVGYLGSNNPCNGHRASTASGKWQFVRDTWARFKGYINAADAPWQVQDEKARLVFAGGAGCSHWSVC